MGSSFHGAIAVLMDAGNKEIRMVVPISSMKKRRLREVKELAQGHRASAE